MRTNFIILTKLLPDVIRSITFLILLAFLSFNSFAQDKYKALLDESKALNASGNLKGAIEKTSEAIKLDDKNYKAYYFRGQFYILTKDFKSAEKDFKTVTEKVDTLYKAYHFRAVCKLNLGDTSSALQLIDKSLKLNPSFFDALHNKGLILQQRKTFSSALEFVTKSLEIQPENKEVNYEKGYCLHMLGKQSDALPFYEKSYSLGYINPTLYEGLAVCYMNSDPNKALLLINKAIAIDSSNSEYYINKALIELNLGFSSMAKSDFEKAINLGAKLNAETEKIYKDIK